MPLYGYICDSCHYEWDDYKSVNKRNSPLDKPCPECGQKAVLRKMSSDTNYLPNEIINGDKNMIKSGVMDNLERMKKHHPYMKWGE